MKQVIIAQRGAKPAGPYSPGIVCQGKFLYVSGQGPVNPETGVAPSTIREAVAQTLTNVKVIVEAAGATMADVVKVNAYLRDMADFPVWNEVYRTFFSEPFPARTTVQSNLNIPVEVDAIVVLPE